MPATNEMYYGIKGENAYKIDRTGKKSILHVSEPDLKNMVAVSTFNDKASKQIEEFVKILGIKKLIKIGGTGKKIIMLIKNMISI